MNNVCHLLKQIMSLYVYGWMNAAGIRRQKVKSSQHQKQSKIKWNKKKLSLSRRISRKLFISLLVGCLVGFFPPSMERERERILLKSQLLYSYTNFNGFISLWTASSTVLQEQLVFRCKYANTWKLLSCGICEVQRSSLSLSLWASRCTVEHALHICTFTASVGKFHSHRRPVSTYYSYGKCYWISIPNRPELLKKNFNGG